jgi:hypothetical protein
MYYHNRIIQRFEKRILQAILSTPWLTDAGIFEYEYLREFAAKIGTARNVVYGT